MTSEYYIGEDSETMVALDTLVERDPQPAPAHYAQYIELGDGSTRGVGWLETEWRWKLIHIDEISALRAYCAAVTAEVAIVTPDVDGIFTTFDALAIWPQAPETLHGDWFQDFAVRFVQLVEVAGTGT
jgi:hypothetical protein